MAAVYPVAAGVPDLSGSYIPRLHASQLLVEFYEGTYLSRIANTDHEEKVKNMGDTVRIRTYPDIDDRPYVKGQPLIYTPGNPSYVDLLIDKGRYWAFPINSVDEVQSDLNMPELWAPHATQKLKINVEKLLLADIYDDVHASNAGATAGVDSGNINLGVSGTPFDFDTTTALTACVNAGQALDEQDVPVEGRWMLLPPAAISRIKLSDLKDASLAGDGTSILRHGRVGMIDRFEIYSSNCLYKTTDGSDTVWNCVFGHKLGLTFAAQVTKTETLPNPYDFGFLMRHLMVYGYKVVKSEALGNLYIKVS